MFLLVMGAAINLGHIRSVEKLTEVGGIIMPPVPFYHGPQVIQDIADHTVDKILDVFYFIEHDLFQRWSGLPE